MLQPFIPRTKILLPRITAAIVAGILTMSALPGAQADQLEANACSNAILHGAYSFTTTGTLDGLPFAVVGRVVFDGQGNFQGSVTLSSNGVIFNDIANAGTYIVNPDCTGSEIVSTTGRGLDFVIVDNATEIQAINTAPDTVLITVAKKQFSDRPDPGNHERDNVKDE